MLLFLIPLKSSKVSNSWENTCLLLERSLRSICAQTHADFKVLVVCHEKPQLAFQHAAIEFLSVDFPRPKPVDYNEAFPMREPNRDKHKKVLFGLLHAQTLGPSHVVLMDADDLVSQQLVAFVGQNETSPGWYIEQGFEYCEGSEKLVFIKDRFYGKCGSSHIVRFDLLEKIAQNTSIDTVDHRFLHHQDVRRLVEEQGAALAPLPFPGAVYVTNHGDNVWASQGILRQRYAQTPLKVAAFYLRKFYKDAIAKKPSASLASEFNLYDLKLQSEA